MAKRRRVSFPTEFGTVSFYTAKERKKFKTWVGPKIPGKRGEKLKLAKEEK